MKGIHPVPTDTNIKFVSYGKLALFISTIGILASIFLFFSRGLNYGIDFIGGTLIEIQTKDAANLKELRKKVGSLGLGDVQLQLFGSPRSVLIRAETQPGGEKAQQAVVDKIKQALAGQDIKFQRTEVVGPTVSGELVTSSVEAVSLSIFAVLFYIWIRFEWQFSLGAIAALVHDVILTIGVFSLTQMEFNLPIIAALLTIVGYSLNDTVVVFDRVRENLRKYKKKPLQELLDLSVNDTLSRTIMTSVTTLVALLALFIFGGAALQGFTFAMIWGVIVGTYSSIFIASPVLLYLGVKRDWSGNAVKGVPTEDNAA